MFPYITTVSIFFLALKSNIRWVFLIFQIFFALKDGKAIGTAAMVLTKEKIFELSKMAVDSRYQGLGIGRMLINKN